MERVGSLSLALVAMSMLGAWGPSARASVAAPVELVSLGTGGVSANHHSGSSGVTPPGRRISADGRYVAFESHAFTIACADPNRSTQDIFVRDRLTGASTLVSVGWDGSPANHNSYDPVISADGRSIAFASQATNLVPGTDPSGTPDIFWRDLQTGTTVLVSASSSGERANSFSHGVALSADGRVVVFYSAASNLVAGDTNNRVDVFARDMVAGTLERVSVTTTGQEGWCCDAVNPSITADGRHVLFLTQSQLDPTAFNQTQEMFLRDRTAGTTAIVLPAADGTLSATGIRFAEISADGRFVAYQSNGNDIVVPDANGFTHDIFRKDLTTGGVTLVSQATDGTQGNFDSWMPSLSADGRYVAFHSWANNLVPDDTNVHPFYDIFVRDMQLGTTIRVNLTPSGGEADGSSRSASISADGTLVYFESTATNLIAGDVDNGFQDVFLAGAPYPGGGTGIQFTAGPLEVPEPAGAAAVSVTRHGPPCAVVSVDYASADGSATADADYRAASGTLTFAVGESTRTFPIVIEDDSTVEPSETIQLTLSRPTGGSALGTRSTATLTILDDDVSVNRPPDAVDDVVSTPEDVALAIDVRANDSDPDRDVLVVTSFTQGTHGAVTQEGDLVVYTPPPNFAGGDAFQYTLGDGSGSSDTATVSVTVTAVNDAPVGIADYYRTRPGATLTVPVAQGILANDRDQEGDALTAVLVEPPAQGGLSLAPSGSFTLVPPESFTGAITFTYRANDPYTAASEVTKVTVVVQAGEVPVSTCRPVTAAAVHRVKTTGTDFMGEPFLGNRRLALIENGTVPCVEVDTMEATRCAFWTNDDPALSRAAPRPSGPWMQDTEGRRWAVVGQPVTRDGSLSHGMFIVGTIPDADGAAPCLASSGHDSGAAVVGMDLAATGMIEEGGAETNVSGIPLQNFVTGFVGTTSVPHPDGAVRVSYDPLTGVGWYTETGAAVNDLGGERDAAGFYYGTDWSYHLVVSNGVEVPAAKRPATRSYPAPGRVNVNSRITWQVVNPYVNIANDAPFDPRVGTGPLARFTHSVGAGTLSLDGSVSEGDILRYTWDLEWTPQNPDASSDSATVTFAVPGDAAPPSGVVRLTVTARDGQKSSFRRDVVLRAPPVAAFTASLGLNTLWVDASASQGDIVRYTWDLGWTAERPDLASSSPTAEFPVAFRGVPPRTGSVWLTVTDRDGRTDTARQDVTFRDRITPPEVGGAPLIK